MKYFFNPHRIFGLIPYLLHFFGFRSAAIKRGQRLLADYAERER